jgi:hypothetical protein
MHQIRKRLKTRFEYWVTGGILLALGTAVLGIATAHAQAWLNTAREGNHSHVAFPPPPDLAAIARVISAQNAAKQRALLPPLEFDHPYTGNKLVTITRVNDSVALRAACLGAITSTACAHISASSCEIFIVADEILEPLGLTYDTSLRHEIGHCNGWPADHPRMGKGASSATAQFRPGTKNQPPQPLPPEVFLECGIVQTTEGYKKDEDPIYKITIRLALDDNRNPAGLDVTHVSASGKSYIRDEQYSDSTLTNTPGKTEYFWSGKMAKDKSYTMKGTLVRTDDNKWYYTEQQFRNGKQRFALRSACHVTGRP